MTFFTKTVAVLAACGSLIAAVPAQARSWDHSGQWGSWSGHHNYRSGYGYRGYSYGFPYGGYRYYRHDNDGAALVVGGLIGLAVGAAIASSNRDRGYYDRYDRYDRRGYNDYDRGDYDRGYYDRYRGYNGYYDRYRDGYWGYGY